MPIQNLSHLNLQGELLFDIYFFFFFEKRFFFYCFFRYGVTRAVKTIVDIKKDEEIFVDYNYGETQPKWYQNLHA